VRIYNRLLTGGEIQTDMTTPIGSSPPPPSSFTLSVTKAGTGSGTVTSTPTGITCGADCSENYVNGTIVALTATPTSGSTFAGWSGDADCSDGSVTVIAAKICTATFTTAAPPPPSGPRAAYGFNEGSGTTTADASGNNFTTTLSSTS